MLTMDIIERSAPRHQFATGKDESVPILVPQQITKIVYLELAKI
jgi:hypothetical protein